MFSKSILVENNVDPDQTTSMEASCSGSTVLPKKGSSRLSMTRLKSYKSHIIIIVCPKITKRSINRLADPEYMYSVITADSPDQTAPLGADCSWIISFAHVT